MKVTRIRKQNGEKLGLGDSTLNVVASEILKRMAKAGFKTGCEVLSRVSMKIGLHMSSFRVDTEKLGHNARVGVAAYGYNGCKSPKGYKRTDVPTWNQRVQFNNIVNDVFDKYKLQCNIRSGAYDVRNYNGGRRNSWNFGGDRQAGYSGHASEEIMTEVEARKQLGSDRLEAEHKAKMKGERREKSIEYRAKIKAARAAKFLAYTFTDYSSKKWARVTKVMSHSEFQRFNAKRTYGKVPLTDLVPLKGRTRSEAEVYLKSLTTQRLELVASNGN